MCSNSAYTWWLEIEINFSFSVPKDTWCSSPRQKLWQKTSVFDSLGMRTGFHLPHRRTPKETRLFISCIPSVWLPFSYFRLFSGELKVKVYLTVSLWLCQPTATHSLLYSVIITLLSQPDTFWCFVENQRTEWHRKGHQPRLWEGLARLPRLHNETKPNWRGKKKWNNAKIHIVTAGSLEELTKICKGRLTNNCRISAFIKEPQNSYQKLQCQTLHIKPISSITAISSVLCPTKLSECFAYGLLLLHVSHVIVTLLNCKIKNELRRLTTKDYLAFCTL